MKNLLFVLLVSAIGFVSCREKIVEPVEDTKLTLAEQITIPCLKISTLPDGHIIRTSEEFKSMLAGSQLPCDAYTPEIDFTKYTLLGMKISASGCQPPEMFAYTGKNATTGNYTFKVEFRPKGVCNAFFQGMCWVLIPKIGPNNTVTFTSKNLQ